MTTPEAAMTREQVLEEALKPFARAADMADYYRTRMRQKPLRDDAPALYPFVPSIADLRRARAALASTRQEPARTYGPTEWPEQLLREVYPSPGSPADLANREPAPAADAEEVARQCVKDWSKAKAGSLLELEDIISAALRRYAGDGGVTDEMVEAAWKEFNCSWLDKAHVRAALEAAARAKPSEKGGAR